MDIHATRLLAFEIQTERQRANKRYNSLNQRELSELSLIVEGNTYLV